MNMEDYSFDGLPLGNARPGTTVLVTGRGRLASKLARQMTLSGTKSGDGAVFVSTNTTGTTLATECLDAVPELDPEGLGIVDVTGRTSPEIDTEVQIETLSSTGDLTGISIKFSILHSALYERGFDRMRVCFDSLSLLLLYTNAKTITRFVHAISGRVSATNSFCVFVMDPSMHEQQVMYTLEHICDGRIDIQASGDGLEVRVDGEPGTPMDWTPVDL